MTTNTEHAPLDEAINEAQTHIDVYEKAAGERDPRDTHFSRLAACYRTILAALEAQARTLPAAPVGDAVCICKRLLTDWQSIRTGDKQFIAGGQTAIAEVLMLLGDAALRAPVGDERVDVEKIAHAAWRILNHDHDHESGDPVQQEIWRNLLSAIRKASRPIPTEQADPYILSSREQGVLQGALRRGVKIIDPATEQRVPTDEQVAAFIREVYGSKGTPEQLRAQDDVRWQNVVDGLAAAGVAEQGVPVAWQIRWQDVFLGWSRWEPCTQKMYEAALAKNDPTAEVRALYDHPAVQRERTPPATLDERAEFEKAFPLLEGVKWDADLQDYSININEPMWAATRLYDRWGAWQTRAKLQSPASPQEPAVQREQAEGWVAVTEGVPYIWRMVLIVVEHEGEREVRWGCIADDGVWMDQEDRDNTGEWNEVLGEVTHWMPLPAPPLHISRDEGQHGGAP